MRKVGIALVLATLLAAGLAFATSRDAARWGMGPLAQADIAAAKGLFETKCSGCHGLDRALGRTKDRSGWTVTVKRMQKVNGCPIGDSEADAIIGYLSKVRGTSPPLM